MLLFRSAEHIQRWLAYRDLRPGATMSLEQCWRLARAWYHSVLDPDWRRRTPEEAQALFAEIGLTGPFWNLRL